MPNELLRLAGQVEIQAGGNDRRPRISISAYSGDTMVVPGYGKVAIDLTGLAWVDSIPLLADHENRIDSIVGHGTPCVLDGSLIVQGTIDSGGAAADRVVELGKSGFPLQASVGVQPEQTDHIRPGESVKVNGRSIKADGGGFTLVRRGVLREVSILAIGADGSTSVSIAAKHNTRNQNMTTENTNVEALDEIQASWNKPDLPDAERIRLRANAVRLQDANLQREVQELVLATAGGKVNFGDFDNALLRIENRDLHLQRIRAEYPRGPAIHGSTRDTGTNVIEAALCLNAGIAKPEKCFDEKVLEAASSRQYKNFGLQQLLTAAAIENGYSHAPGERVSRGNLRDILQTALPGGSIRAAGSSTLDVSGLLSNVANKMLLDGFNAAPQKWREVASTRTVSDFKQATAYRMTADLEYEELPPSGEIQHGTLGEESYTMQAKTYAKMLTLTRTDIINDDLGAFDDLRQRLGIGAVVKMNKVFWTLWVNNSAFFTSARGNYQEGAATALGEAGLNAAVKLFRDMTGPDGNAMDLDPAVLLVPTDLEATAKKLYVATEIRDTTASTKTPTANIYFDRFKPVAVPQLSNSAYTGYSAKAWYLLADPAILATAAMCFLNGQQSPTIESADADFNTLGIQLRGYHDFGVAMSEYRAGVKSKGEA